MRIFVSAAEISSDLQAEKILRELIALYPAGTVEISGIGGPKLRALPGFKTIEEAENLRAMGFTEVLGKLVTLRKILKQAVSYLEAFKPDLIITFDYPDFHFALLKECAKRPELQRAIKICGIPPKVWVWRSHRLNVIRKIYDAVWVLFPFEKELYERAGIPVIFEGNPLIGDVLAAATSKNSWITDTEIRLAVLPGSREAEIRQHLEVIPEALELLAQKTKKKIIAEVPVPEGLAMDAVQSALQNSAQVTYQITQGSSSRVLAQNSLGLIKSGTSTLEAAVLGCVPVIFYRVSFVTRLIFQFLVRYEGAVGLPNILLGVKKRKDAVFPELLGPEATPQELSEQLFKFIQNPALLAEKQKAGLTLQTLLVPSSGISAQVAKKLKAFIDGGVARPVSRKESLWIGLASFLWSSLNASRRKFYELGILKAEKISVPSVLVGNLQAGGAGKTPIVIGIAEEAIKRGYRVGVVSRGYGGSYTGSSLVVSHEKNVQLIENANVIGDEPAEILAALPKVTLGLGRNRAQVAKELEALGINFLVFDDGFQNLKFKTQHTVLAISDAKPNQVVFRDFLSAHRFADFVFQTKGLPAVAPIPAQKIAWKVEEMPKGPIWLLCGVADPSEVAQFYRNLGVQIDRVIALPDHAEFDFKQVKAWSDEAKTQGAVLSVTQKDWVKLKSDSSLTLFILKRKISSEGWLEPIFKR
jgi:lipid-A-disaccharide synthase